MNTYKLTSNDNPATQIPVRFFVYDPEGDDEMGDLVETNLSGFLAAEGEISVEQHTVFENGVAQIVLTKMPKG
jgi:hypothetical protein